MSKHIEYHRTVTGRGIEVHLADAGADLALCGLDITPGFCSYDDNVHAEQPHKLSVRTEVTCPDCLNIIAIVNEHMRGTP